MKKIMFLIFISTFIFAANYKITTNTPENRLAPNISNDGSIITEYITKKDKKTPIEDKNEFQNDSYDELFNSKSTCSVTDECESASTVQEKNTDVSNNMQIITNTGSDSDIKPGISNNGSTVYEYITK